MNLENNETFYEACSKVLGIPHEYREPPKRRTRWNTRQLGNGRFPGFGVVRAYASVVIIMCRQGTRTFPDRAAALEWLTDLKREGSA